MGRQQLGAGGAPKAKFLKVGALVEVCGAEPGFYGSWYTAHVTALRGDGVALRYEQLLKDDGTPETEVVTNPMRMRPLLGPWLARAGGAARATRLEDYEPGDTVEVEYEEGWCVRCTSRAAHGFERLRVLPRAVRRWEGFVHIARDADVVLSFSSNPSETMTVRARPARPRAARR